MLWSYTVRVESDEAAVAAGTAQQQGVDAADIALRLHVSCWEGAAREAVTFYPQREVRRVFEDPTLEKHAAGRLERCQLNQTVVPIFTADVLEQVRDLVDLARDPARAHELEIKELQHRYAVVNAELAPTLAEAKERAALIDALSERGAAPDPELNARVKRELGIEDTPFNT